MPQNISEFYPQFKESQVEIDSKTYTALVLADLDSEDGLQIERVVTGQKLGDYIFENKKIRSKFHIFITSEKESWKITEGQGQDIEYPKSVKINGFEYSVLSGVLMSENLQITPFYQLEIIKA